MSNLALYTESFTSCANLPQSGLIEKVLTQPVIFLHGNMKYDFVQFCPHPLGQQLTVETLRRLQFTFRLELQFRSCIGYKMNNSDI